MLSVEEARRRILAPLTPTTAEVVGLAEAWQRVTAQPVIARLTQPPADVSAMDGYAVRAADAAAGAHLRLVGAAPAGHPWPGVLGPGEALRLFTGSILPQGADAVLVQEDAEEVEGLVHIRTAVAAGRYVRPRGQDFAAGEVIVPASRRLSAPQIGLLAAANHPWVVVHRRPRVAILATGDELALPGEPIGPGGIVASNSHALAALVRGCGGEAVVLPLVKDDAAALAGAAAAARGMDLFVTNGGASVGAFDLVRSALAPVGLAVDFWQVAMRPGKPVLFGRLGEVPLLGLPGNPVSSLVSALLFLWPALERLAGLPPTGAPHSRARLAAPLPANDWRADHLRGSLEPAADGTLCVRAFPRQDSALLRLLAEAEVLILRPPHAPAAAVGDEVEVIRLDQLGW